MFNHYFFPTLEPVAVPLTNAQTIGAFIQRALTKRKQAPANRVVIPSVDDLLVGYFKVVDTSSSAFNVNLEAVEPGAVLPESAVVVRIEYEVPHPLVLEERELHRRPDRTFVVSQRRYDAEICVSRGFSHRVMSELLNRWICACDLAQVPTRSYDVRATFPAPALRAFDGFTPNYKEDGILYLRLVN